MGISVKSIGVSLAGLFVIWYLLRRTSLGSAFSSDLWAVPQYFTSFVGAQTQSQSQIPTRNEIYRR